MKDNIKVSIITVTYNSASTIADTIQSVKAQTYPNIEYVIIDGASTDGTLDIVKSFQADFGERLRYISEPDKGIYDAMNKGFQGATGDIVGTLNSDDFFTSNEVIGKMVENFNADDIDAVYGDVHFVNAENLSKCTRYYSSKNFKPWKLRFGFMPAHPSFYIRREILLNAGLYKTDYKIGADYEMMVRLFHQKGIRSKYIPMDFVTMRAGGTSTKNISSKITLIKEDVRGCRENGLYTNTFMVCLKFFVKIFEYKFI